MDKNLRLVAAGVVAVGLAIGLYGFGPTSALNDPTAPGTGVDSGSEDLGTYDQGGATGLDSRLLAPEDVGTGWMVTAYEPSSGALCPLKDIAGYRNEGRVHTGFQDQSSTTVAHVVTQYPTGDGPLVAAALAGGFDRCRDGFADDLGQWTLTSAARPDGIDASLVLESSDPAVGTLSVEYRWRYRGDVAATVMVMSAAGPQRELADQVAGAAASRLG